MLKITVYDTDYNTGERIGDPIRTHILDATEFAWEGCHKIYLIFTPEDRAKMESYGYEGDYILPVSELPEIWDVTCGLRFISSADLTQDFVSQCESADVTYEAGVKA